jgi:hypothetical protein
MTDKMAIRTFPTAYKLKAVTPTEFQCEDAMYSDVNQPAAKCRSASPAR